MKIGITGGRGVLGTILVKKMKSWNYEYDSFKGDISKIDDIREWVNSNNFDSIIHLAAIVPASVVKDSLVRAFEVNAVGTRNLAEVLKEKSKNIWLFYASTSHVYKSSDKPISEKGTIEPVSEYGLTKYSGELLARKIYENLCIGRIFSMYHKTQKPPFLYPNIIKRLKTEDLDKEFELYGGESYRDFLNAEEVADIILELMNKNACGIYNIASGNGIKVKDFVQSITDKKIKIKSLGEPDYLVANINKLEKLLNEKKDK